MNKLILVAMLSLSGCGFGHNEDGYHRGKVTDVSTAGWFCSTYEGEIMSGSGNASVKYDFTVTDKATYEKLKVAQAQDLAFTLAALKVACDGQME